jgi:hypothetical protein
LRRRRGLACRVRLFGFLRFDFVLTAMLALKAPVIVSKGRGGRYPKLGSRPDTCLASEQRSMRDPGRIGESASPPA